MDQTSKIKSADFAHRLEQACENNPSVPKANFGRLGWIKERLKERFGTDVTIETVRKWLAGETRPRHEKVMQLATLLGVKPEYLLMGDASGVTEKDRQLPSAESTGIVNVLAGLIAMDGGCPTFPSEDDNQAKRFQIDLYAKIKAVNYRFSVVLGKKVADGWEFLVPMDALDETVVIGARRPWAFCFEFLELDADAIRAQGKDIQGKAIQVKVPDRLQGTSWKRIETFAERLP